MVPAESLSQSSRAQLNFQAAGPTRQGGWIYVRELLDYQLLLVAADSADLGNLNGNRLDLLGIQFRKNERGLLFRKAHQEDRRFTNITHRHSYLSHYAFVSPIAEQAPDAGQHTAPREAHAPSPSISAAGWC